MAGVLVIDDEQDIQLLCRLNMAREGLAIREATCGADGLEMAAQDIPEVVVLDIMMPEMDGFEVLRRLKDDARTCDVPVVMLTARTSEEDRRRSRELGAALFVTKPFAPDELAKSVDALIGETRGP